MSTDPNTRIARTLKRAQDAYDDRLPPDYWAEDDDSEEKDDADTVKWALRGHWLVDKLTERTLPDGRVVLELSEEDIFVTPDATLDEYVEAVDAAMQRDSEWGRL